MIRKMIALVILVVCSREAICQQSESYASSHGKVVYEKTCLTCHQAGGGGVPHMNPPLIHAGLVNGNKKKLIEWVLRGSSAQVHIDGKYYSNNMPSQTVLSDRDIAEVLTGLKALA